MKPRKPNCTEARSHEDLILLHTFFPPIQVEPGAICTIILLSGILCIGGSPDVAFSVGDLPKEGG
jgi:hypothetical protein